MSDVPFTADRPSLARAALRKPGFVAGLLIIGLSTLLAIFPGAFAPYDPNAIDYLAVRQPPSWEHPFGTDLLGRDSLSRVIWAYQVNMQMAIFGTVFALVTGVIIGALVGYYRSIADLIFGRIVDAVITFPFLVLVIAVVAVLGPGLINMYIAISVVYWVYYARLMRAEVIAQMGNDYAAAGVVMGYSDRRIIFRHLLPNAITPVIVYWMTDMALVILLGSSLGYLGLGAQPPQAEWGVLIAEGRNFISTAWWLSLMPGLAIVLTGLGFSLLGDGLADLLRPRGKEMTERTPILEVQGLNTTFHRNGRELPALRDVSFSVARGEVLGLVGESSSGKSVTLRSIIGLARRYGDVSGQVRWQGRDLVPLPDRALRQVQGREIAMIFQEPMTSLNPLLTVGLQLEETLRAHTDLSGKARRDRAVEMLDLVGIPSAAQRLRDYPHQFSGGMRQRVMIAIALAANPRLLLADEPTTALDVTIQAQILDLILRLADEMEMGVVLVTHDLGVVAQTCDNVAVIYAGRIVEQGPVRDVLREPRHPYTVGLMRSVPENLTPRTPLYSVPGVPPSLDALPQGCAFAPRCEACIQPCQQDRPVLSVIADSRQVACFNPVTKAEGNAA